MDKDFEKQNVFGLGKENSAYAQYFIGKSYLNPLTPAGTQPFFANVTFEPGCRNNWHIHRESTTQARAADRYCYALRAAAGIRSGANPHSR